jgi:hypothetical protein
MLLPLTWPALRDEQGEDVAEQLVWHRAGVDPAHHIVGLRLNFYVATISRSDESPRCSTLSRRASRAEDPGESSRF